MNSGIFLIPIAQIMILFIMSVLTIYIMILTIKALKLYLKNNS